MTQISLADAQLNLSDLVDATGHGEEIVITRDGKPVAKLSPVSTPSRSARFGSAQGLIVIADDFDVSLDDFRPYTE